MSAASPAQKTSPIEPYRFGEGWRVDATCRHCGATVYLDSEDKPGERSLQIAGFAIGCDHCVGEQEAAEERSRLHVGLSDRVRLAGLPGDLQGLSWGDMDRSSGRRDTIVAGRAWAESDRGKMLLYGPKGTGKTRLAATAAWDLLERGNLTWISVPLLFVHAFLPATSPERRRAVEVMGGKGPLILDDLGKEKPGEWARQVLFGAIDSRLQAGSPILITSNFDPDGIADRLGEAVGSRLLEFKQFELAGRDRRGEMETES